ncbi:hypothetical protein, partial [Staphylococcus aureus]
SLDKLIGRQETTYNLSSEKAHIKTGHQQINQRLTATETSIDVQKGLDIISEIPLFNRTKQDIRDTLTRL